MEHAITATERANVTKSLKPWLICIIAAVFYCYAYYLRVSPSAMMNELLASFHINASQFGMLSAFYYYSYTPMQIPVGVVIDRYGVRLVLSIACLFAVLGLALFISSQNFYFAAAGRFLMGFGSAFAYLSVLKLATVWLPPNRFAIMAGLTTSMGMVAAAFSEKYLITIVSDMGYRHALFSSLLAGLIIAALIFFFVRNRPKSHNSSESTEQAPLSYGQLFQALWKILKNRQMWLIGLIGCLLYLPASVFLDVWGIPYLETVHSLSPQQASTATAMVFIGWIIASPIIGAISDGIRMRRLPLLLASMVAFAVLMVIFYGPTLSHTALYILMFILGMSCGSHPLCFSLSKENNSVRYSGTATALTNTMIMLGGVVCQPLVGILLDWHGVGLQQNGIATYSVTDYTFALSIVPISLLLSIVLTLFVKETHCKVKH